MIPKKREFPFFIPFPNAVKSLKTYLNNRDSDYLSICSEAQKRLFTKRLKARILAFKSLSIIP
uniref:Uncharacterized protein n=1 Tax=Siphoviridae sp. ctXQq5 TaxID=2826368 RepID=A0A8S5N1P2_9CAUD|nr:MAG TPA: hypothetical protein [Siphoviridae sp. ctXQq5]